MIKSKTDLVEVVSNKLGVKPKLCSEIINVFMEQIRQELSNDNTVCLRGLMRFRVINRKPHAKKPNALVKNIIFVKERKLIKCKISSSFSV
jgi:nucleoid DNA-binding protein